MVTTLDRGPGGPWLKSRVGGCQNSMKLVRLHMAYLSFHLFGVLEQLNIRAITGAYKLIDGCSLELCSATP